MDRRSGLVHVNDKHRAFSTRGENKILTRSTTEVHCPIGPDQVIPHGISTQSHEKANPLDRVQHPQHIEKSGESYWDDITEIVSQLGRKGVICQLGPQAGITQRRRDPGSY
ncbi:hypothetical protein AAMO2058_000034400 [Amorphochlora amoebiformis]